MRTYREGLRLASLGAALLVGTSGVLAGEVNVYTNREPGLYSATLDEFTKATGIKVNAIFSEQGLAERIAAEGEKSPADVLITVDIGRLQQALDLGVAAPIRSEVVASAVPANLRDPEGRWTALSMRARTIYVSKERVQDTALTYESLADPKWKGKVCTRSFQHPYNVALTAAMIVKKGEEKTKAWLEGVKANLAKKPSGGDRDVAKDIAAGVCDLGLGNSYYVGLMANGKNEEQKKWAAAIRPVLPTFEGGATHVNVSGAVVTKHAPNRDNAIKLIEYMTSPDAQQVFADVNYEYPIRAGVPVNAFVASFGALKPDPMSLADVAKARKRASELVDEVGFDR
ncbi:extracellular solute-binding protein [Enterovirga aerilata]|uniref:Fe(3+) ABC transporter substrate-binding protein n=1 Tax=Enterovirga aerilata TaxID=2730920 RepID=A0A849IKS9_9HYPH|nr:Fe(3+) ABC transporter substrate-binding protein [Enterovirga sp. DB1703]